MTETLTKQKNKSFPAVHESLREASRFVEETLEKSGVARVVRNRTLVILDELTTNLLKHAYKGEDSARFFEVVVAVDDEKIVLTRIDDTEYFDPTQQPGPNLESDLGERPIGGLGIHLCRELGSGMSYRREDDRNVVVVEIPLNGSSAGSSQGLVEGCFEG